MNPIFDFFLHYGLITIFLAMVIENLGIPLPTEFGYLAAIALVKSDHLSLAWVLILLTIGHVLGALISYLIGQWSGETTKNRLKHSHRFYRINQRVTQWYENYVLLVTFALGLPTSPGLPTFLFGPF
jgi:membrane protein DedA with SNARE-associated domain